MADYTDFLLDPGVIFLNHGSFGACPRPVFAEYQRWQVELERQPVDFIARRSGELLAHARQCLGSFLNASAEDLVFFPNSTTAFNMAVRSLEFKPGDEVLSTDQEYPAILNTWRYLEQKKGVRFIQHHLPLPLTDLAGFVDYFWAGVNERTKVIFLSHIPFALGLILPVAEICRRARAAGIITIIDGAHVPGQIPLDLQAVGADIYFGACHKWLMAPKGASFLYARPAAQEWLTPLVISRGFGPQAVTPNLTPFIDFNEYQGTRDLSAFLTVPSAIDFQKKHRWTDVQARCHTLAEEARTKVNKLTGLDPLSPDGLDHFGQLAAVRMPEMDEIAFQERLYQQYKIEVPLVRWNGGPLLMRISIQAYNTPEDIEVLIHALNKELGYSL